MLVVRKKPDYMKIASVGACGYEDYARKKYTRKRDRDFANKRRHFYRRSEAMNTIPLYLLVTEAHLYSSEYKSMSIKIRFQSFLTMLIEEAYLESV